MLLATAIAYAARKFDLVDLLVIEGVLVLPTWLVCTGRLLRERPLSRWLEVLSKKSFRVAPFEAARCTT